MPVLSDAEFPRAMRHKIIVQRKTITGQDSRGQDECTWTTIGTYWAAVKALQGSELVAAQQRWAEAKFTVTIHYTGIIQRADRIVWGARQLDILDAEDPSGDSRILQMTCREFVS